MATVYRVLTLIETSDDLILYTITTDSTLRVFLPVLDSPQRLQLHGSIDLSSSISHSIISSQRQYQTSQIFHLDRSALDQYLQKSISPEKLEQEDASARRLRDIKDEEWDLFLRVLGDGNVILTALTVSSRYLVKFLTLDKTARTLTVGHPPY